MIAGATPNPMPSTTDDVVLVERCDLEVMPGRWAYADANREAIAAHWARRIAESPRLFNGVVHLLGSWEVSGDIFSGRFLRTDFASFLHWRECGHPDAGVRDCFGSALIRSADGHVLLGRQRPGQVNSGLLYPPSGFIDPADIRSDGHIDILANIAREIAEETGLDAGRLEWRPGYRVAFSGAQVALAREGHSGLGSEALRRTVLDHLASEAEPELVDIVMIDEPTRIGSDTPAYARLLLRSLLEWSKVPA